MSAPTTPEEAFAPLPEFRGQCGDCGAAKRKRLVGHWTAVYVCTRPDDPRHRDEAIPIPNMRRTGEGANKTLCLVYELAEWVEAGCP